MAGPLDVEAQRDPPARGGRGLGRGRAGCPTIAAARSSCASSTRCRPPRSPASSAAPRAPSGSSSIAACGRSPATWARARDVPAARGRRDRRARHRRLPRVPAGRPGSARRRRAERGRARSRGPLGRGPAGCRRPTRVHPSFRFEERLAARLADAAARMTLARAAGAEDAAAVVPISAVELDLATSSLGPGRPARSRRPGPAGGARRDPPAAAHRRDARLGRAVDRRRRDRRLAAEPDAAWRVRADQAGLMPIKLPSFRARRDVYPADLWTKCPSCEEQLFNKQLDKTLRVCPNCGHHFRLSAAARLDHLLDEGSFEERDPGLHVGRPARVRRPEVVPGPGRGRPAGDRDARRRRSGAPARSPATRS